MTDDAEAAHLRAELAEMTYSLVRLADVLSVNLVEAAHAKIDANNKR